MIPTARRIKYPKLPAIGGSRAVGDDRAKAHNELEKVREENGDLLAVRGNCLSCLFRKLRERRKSKDNIVATNTQHHVAQSVAYLAKKIAEFEKQIEELKCCGNCLYYISNDCECGSTEQHKQKPEPEDVCRRWEFWQ